MLIPIERGAREPVAKQIVQYLRRAIDAGRLRPGTKLEPIRVLARELGVNRETVAAAYHELEVLGLTESTVGRGTFVLARATAADGREGGEPRPRQRPFEPVFSRRSTAATALAAVRVDYSAPADAVHLERLIPDGSLVPDEDFRKALNRALRKGGAALYDYGDPRGSERLRRALVERLARSGIECAPEDVLITAGSTQGFAVAVQLFCDPGDAVVVESPTYPWALGALRSYGLRVAPVPIGEHGLDLDRLAAVLARGDVRLIYTMPSFQNPTAVSTSVDHRRQLLEIAGRYGVPILEDDFEKDLRVRGRGAPPLRALDGSGLVVYLGTFSKALFPAVRVGWLIAPRRIADAAATVKRLMDITTSPLLQAGLAATRQRRRSGVRTTFPGCPYYRPAHPPVLPVSRLGGLPRRGWWRTYRASARPFPRPPARAGRVVSAAFMSVGGSRTRSRVLCARVPILSIFFGIVVRMFHDDHPPGHFHVEYAEYRAVIEITTGRRLQGRLPRRLARLIEEWRRMHVRQLERAWTDAQAGRQPRKIPPLT